MRHDEAGRPRRELRGRLVQQPRSAEHTELGEHGLRHGRAHAVEDLCRQRDVLVDELRLLGERIRNGEMHLDRVGAGLGRPRRAAGVILHELLRVHSRRPRADHADDQHLPRPDAVLRAPNVLAPHLGLDRRNAERDGQRRLPVDALRGGDRRVLAVLDGTNVRQCVRGHRHRADGLVREHVEAHARVRLDPLAVEQRAGGDADRRVQRVIEELAAGSGRHSADARQRRRVTVVPRVRPIDAIDGLRDDFTPYIRSQRQPPVYQILTSHADFWSDRNSLVMAAI